MFIHEEIELGYDDLTAVTSKKGRTYETPDGKKYPSITTCLSHIGADALHAWRKRVGEEEANKIGAKAARRGTAVHDIIEKYVRNDDDYKNKHQPHVIESFLSVQETLDQNLNKVYAQEVALFSHYLGVAGRVDCVGVWNGVPSIIDFKTSRRLKKKENIETYFMQECFYAIAWEERTGMPIEQLVTLIVVDDHTPQVFIEHRDNWDKKLIDAIAEHKRRQR